MGCLNGTPVHSIHSHENFQVVRLLPNLVLQRASVQVQYHGTDVLQPGFCRQDAVHEGRGTDPFQLRDQRQSVPAFPNQGFCADDGFDAQRKAVVPSVYAGERHRLHCHPRNGACRRVRECLFVGFRFVLEFVLCRFHKNGPQLFYCGSGLILAKENTQRCYGIQLF